MLSTGMGTQWVPEDCQVSSLQLPWAQEEGGPFLRLWLRIWTQRVRRRFGGTGHPGGAEEKMPPVLAFASDLLLNKHISGLRVKYIGLQQSGRPSRDQLPIFVQTLNLLSTMTWTGELHGARPFSKTSNSSAFGQLERPASRELWSTAQPTSQDLLSSEPREFSTRSFQSLMLHGSSGIGRSKKWRDRGRESWEVRPEGTGLNWSCESCEGLVHPLAPSPSE